MFLPPQLLDGTVTEPDMSACFCPDHKAPMVLFLERVYGIEDQAFLLHMLEVGFLPDLKASASLDTVSGLNPVTIITTAFRRIKFSIAIDHKLIEIFFTLVDM